MNFLKIKFNVINQYVEICLLLLFLFLPQKKTKSKSNHIEYLISTHLDRIIFKYESIVLLFIFNIQYLLKQIIIIYKGRKIIN